MRTNEADREITVQNPRRYRSLQTSDLRLWLDELLRELAPDTSSFGVRLIDDDEMRQLNWRFRGLDRPTDVLSFPGGDTEEGHHLGDVVISIPTARAQAEQRGHSTRSELRLLLVHGVLHCLGYDHEADSGEMDRIESRLRRRWGIDVD